MRLSFLLIFLPFSLSLCWGQTSFNISSSDLIDEFVEVTSSTTTDVYLYLSGKYKINTKRGVSILIQIPL
ncbi:hypothetical protein EI427_00765 [Flammeovirga pectinis]|uniref:Auto-transporter adhesin head GIN domain-containing protein n=1 Tax=Flammeovirga pectinis TaxID=2494373 RepID=A0A3Q9FI97_9BACT|nr:hypothetical protein [Flammeovirga pectinis]AZQ60792.1 hypothetical protein EI427_00765 [Flammeovirga pectinis]